MNEPIPPEAVVSSLQPLRSGRSAALSNLGPAVRARQALAEGGDSEGLRIRSAAQTELTQVRCAHVGAQLQYGKRRESSELRQRLMSALGVR